MIKNLEINTVCKGTTEYPRSSEAAVIETDNNELFIVWQRYEKSIYGSEDNAPNKLVSMRSSDGARTWDDFRIEVTPKPGDVNVYSPNLIRLQDGSILFVHMHYIQLEYGKKTLATVVASRSYDGCVTFADTSVMWDTKPYAIASSTIRLLSDNRIMIPIETDRNGKEEISCAFSDDYARTWTISPGWATVPMRGAMEGHIVELKDKRLMMVMRTQLGAVFKSHSYDRGLSWTKPQTTGMRAPESCPELVRIPHSQRLMLVWNNSKYDPDFRSHYGLRTPLSIAVSDDEGDTFTHIGDIETDPGWGYSNPGAYFMKNNKCILNYWATEYASDWSMTGNIDLKTAVFDID